MNRPKDTTWLDQAIAQTAPAPAPRPDYAAWRQVHASALDTLKRRGRDRQRSIPLWRIIMESKIVRVAAVAVLVIGVFVLVRHIAGAPRFVRQPGQSIVTDPEATKKHGRFEMEWKLAQVYVNDGNVSGLVELLETGTGATQFIAAGYLGEMGDSSALAALHSLAEQWTGEESDNPFQKAIDLILHREQTTEPNRMGDPNRNHESVSIEGSTIQYNSSSVITKQSLTFQGRVSNQAGEAIEQVKGQSNIFPFEVGDHDIVVTLKPGGFIKGKIVYENGQAYTGPAVIVVSTEDIYELVYHADAQGRFTTTGLTPGQHWVHAMAPDEHNLCPPVEIDVALDSNGTDVTLVIRKGRVIDEEGDSVIGIRVHTDVGSTLVETVTDRKGRFVLKGLPQGHKLRVGLYAPGYGHCSQRVVVDGNEVDIQIIPQGWDLLDKEAPPLQVGQWYNSEPITLERLRGKVVLLQVGVLLPNYGRDLTQAQEVFQKYYRQGLEVIAIHQPLGVDWAGKVTETDIEQFLANNDVPFVLCLDAGRSNGNTYSQYDVKATPALYLIDRQGKIRVSPLREELDEQIKTLLQE